VAEITKKRGERRINHRKRKNKKSALYPIPTHTDSREIQEVQPKRGYEQEKKRNEKETGKRVPHYACVQRVVIASSRQTARMTHSDARRPTPPTPQLPCMVYVVCRAMWCTSCITAQRKRISIQSRRVGVGRIHLSRRKKKLSCWIRLV
jgi:hypothetical protein